MKYFALPSFIVYLAIKIVLRNKYRDMPAKCQPESFCIYVTIGAWPMLSRACNRTRSRTQTLVKIRLAALWELRYCRENEGQAYLFCCKSSLLLMYQASCINATAILISDGPLSPPSLAECRVPLPK